MLLQLSLCAVLLLQFPSSSLQQCPATSANAVQIKFYRAQVDAFSSENGERDVAVEVLSEANVYCGSISSECDLLGGYNTTNQFKDLHVVTSPGFPKDELKDMLHELYLLDPDNSTCAVKKEFLKDIIERARDDIHEATGYWITYIDTDFYGIPPPGQLNRIIIPIAFVVLLFLIILTIVLAKLHSRREAAERRERILRERKKKSQKSTAKPYTQETEPATPGHKLGTPAKDELYKENLRKSNLSKQTASIASEDSAIKVDTADSGMRQRQPYSYENQGATGYDGDDDLQGRDPYNHLKPIDRSATGDGEVEKKKKKKKKKSKSKEADQTSEVIDDYNTDPVNDDY